MKTLLCVLASAAVLMVQAAEKPNILWIVAEDINSQLGCFGDTNAVTPNLDRFSERSLRYRNCWSAAPVCAPARTALITGVYPPSLGAEHMRSLVAMPSFMRMYPQILREAGYYCVNNSKEDYNVEKRGTVWDESSNKAHWKNRKPGQPFFAAFNLNVTHESQIRKRPHTLVTDPSKVRLPAYHPDTPEVRHDWAQYYDNIMVMDRQVQERLQELSDAGLDESTIVFFYGDNGGGMPRSKRWPYNSGLEVPLIVHVPERFRRLAPADYQSGGATSRLVSFVDFAPTLLSIADIPQPGWMQGQPFMGTRQAPPAAYLFGFRGRMDERYDLVRSVGNGRYIYIRNYMPHLIYGQHLAYMFETPTTQKWKELYDAGKLQPPQTFFWERKPAEELYDLESDPDEVRNLAEMPAQKPILTELRSALRAHLLQTRDLGFLTEAEQHRRNGNSSLYEFGHDPEKYPMEQVLEAAERASMPAANDVPRLTKALSDKEAGVRYWAATGFLVRGSNAVQQAGTALRKALEDESPSVRIAAARALGVYGEERDLAPALKVLGQCAPPDQNGVFVSLEALSAIEALGAKAETLRPMLRKMSREAPDANERTSSYVPRLLDDILGTEAPPPERAKNAGKRKGKRNPSK